MESITDPNADQSDPPASHSTYPRQKMPIAVAILEAIADDQDIAVTELEFQLFDYLDPEALNKLYRHSLHSDQAAWRFNFEADDVQVTLHSDGRIVVDRGQVETDIQV